MLYEVITVENLEHQGDDAVDLERIDDIALGPSGNGVRTHLLEWPWLLIIDDSITQEPGHYFV